MTTRPFPAADSTAPTAAREDDTMHDARDAHDARHTHDDDHDPCGGCPVAPTRRAFLRDSLLALSATLVGLGATRSSAEALPVRLVRAIGAGDGAAGDTRRYPLPAADGVQIDRDAEVILVRWQGSVYAFALSCPHQRTALRWVEGDHRFQCPKHKSKYQPDGTFIEGRATRNMDRFDVQRDGADVVVDLGALHRQDADPAGWAAAVVRVA